MGEARVVIRWQGAACAAWMCLGCGGSSTSRDGGAPRPVVASARVLHRVAPELGRSIGERPWRHLAGCAPARSRRSRCSAAPSVPAVGSSPSPPRFSGPSPHSHRHPRLPRTLASWSPMPDHPAPESRWTPGVTTDRGAGL